MPPEIPSIPGLGFTSKFTTGISTSLTDPVIIQTLSENLISYWPLNETSGTRQDAHYEIDLTGHNVFSSSDSNVYSRSALLTATLDTLSSDSSNFSNYALAPIYQEDYALSVSFWIKNNNPGTPFVSRSYFRLDYGTMIDITHADYTGILDPPQILQLTYGPYVPASQSAYISINNTFSDWTMITFVIDPSNDQVKIYIDGQSVSITSSSITLVSGIKITIPDIWVGGSYQLKSDSYMGPAAVWRKALSDSEVTALYNNGNGLELSEIANYSNDNLVKNLVSFWPLNELSGSRTDQVGSNHLTDNSTVENTSAAKLYSNAASFTHSNSEKLTIADGSHSGLDITGDMTVSFWVNYSSLPSSLTKTPGLVSKYDAGTNQRSWGVWSDYTGDNTDKIQFTVSSDGSATTSVVNTTVVTDTWYHVVAVHDSTNELIKLIVDNNTPVSASHTGGLFNSSADFAIGFIDFGATDSDRYFDGKIEAVSIWNRSLSASEITSLYNSGSGLKLSQYDDYRVPKQKTALVGWVSLDEASGNRYTIDNRVVFTDTNTVSSSTGLANALAASFDRNNNECLIQDDNFGVYRDLFAFGNISSAIKLQSFTASVWVKINELQLADDMQILACWNIGNSWRWRLYVDPTPPDSKNIFCFQTSSGATIDGQVSATDYGFAETDKWYHLAVWGDEATGEMGIWVDGVITTSTTQGIAQFGNNPFCIGGQKFGGSILYPFDGLIENVGVWGRVLTKSELTELYNNGRGVTYDTLI